MKRKNYKYHDVKYLLLLNNYALLRGVFLPQNIRIKRSK